MSANDTSTDLAPRLAAEAEAAPPARPQYMVGFEGAGMAPFSEDIRKVLAAPVDPDAVEIKPDGIVFLPGIEWTRQLTRAFGAGGWAIMPRSPARTLRDNNIVTYHGALVCHGRFVAEAVGECAYFASNPTMSYATALEGATTDAIGRCCKRLSIFSELWDKAFIERWKAKYAETYEGSKWSKKDNKYITAKMWRRKDHADRRPLDDLDLMAGAGGVVPAAKESAPAAPKEHSASKLSVAPRKSSGSTPPKSDSSVTPTTSASSPTTTSAPDAIAPPSIASADTGEAATDEQKAALRGHVKRLGWKGHFAKMWLKGLVGFDNPDSLTADQCTNACMLAERWGQDSYKPLLEDLRKDGLVRPEQAA